MVMVYGSNCDYYESNTVARNIMANSVYCALSYCWSETHYHLNILWHRLLKRCSTVWAGRALKISSYTNDGASQKMLAEEAPYCSFYGLWLVPRTLRHL